MFLFCLRHNKHVFFVVELNYRLLCSSNRWFWFQLINHLSLCSTRVRWGYNISRMTMTPSIASSRLKGGSTQGTKVHGARKRRTEAVRHRYTNHHCELLPLLCYNHALFHGLVRSSMLFVPWLSPCRLLCQWSSVGASSGYFICCW